MDSKGNSADFGDCMSKKRNERASAVDRKTISKTDGSSTPMESKRHCTESRDRMLVLNPDGSSAIGRNSTSKIDGSSKPTGQVSVSSVVSTKPHGKAAVSDDSGVDIMFFVDVTPDPHEAEMRFRLIHY